MDLKPEPTLPDPYTLKGGFGRLLPLVFEAWTKAAPMVSSPVTDVVEA
jgi:hypothetical protein